MILIDTNKMKNWELIKERHKDWWIAHLNEIKVLEIIKNSPNEEQEFLLFLLNDNEDLPIECLNVSEETSIETTIPNIKNFIVNDDLHGKIPKLIKNLKCLKNENKDLFDYINNHLFEKKTKDQIIKMKWKGFLAKANSNIEKEFIFFLIKNSELTQEEKEKIADLKDTLETKEFLQSFSMSQSFLSSSKDEKKKNIARQAFYESLVKKILKEKTEFESNLEKIFDYNKFSKDKSSWGRTELLKKMDIRVCPYCQRQYITSINSKDEEIATADIDHYFCQKVYPFFALSLYNLIPSCQICNSRFKNQEDFFEHLHIYPYKETFEDNAIFELKGDYAIKLMCGDSNIELNLSLSTNDENLIKKIGESDKTFKLNQIYKQSHMNYVLEIYENLLKHPDEYVEDIMSVLSINKKDPLLREKVKEIIIKPYKDKIKKGEPLGKFTKDILEQFKYPLEKNDI